MLKPVEKSANSLALAPSTPLPQPGLAAHVDTAAFALGPHLDHDVFPEERQPCRGDRLELQHRRFDSRDLPARHFERGRLHQLKDLRGRQIAAQRLELRIAFSLNLGERGRVHHISANIEAFALEGPKLRRVLGRRRDVIEDRAEHESVIAEAHI